MKLFYIIIFLSKIKELEMKKFLLALGIVSLVASSAFGFGAVTGPVQRIEQWGALNAYYITDKDNSSCVRKFIGSAELGVDGQKTFNALILTAMATGKNVTVSTMQELTECGSATPAEAMGIIVEN
jgi:hypothetical protein